MKAPISRLKELFAKYPSEFRCAYFNELKLDRIHCAAGSDVTPSELSQLSDLGFQEIEIIYNVTVYEYFHNAFPAEYRKGSLRLDFFEIDRMLEELDTINGLSKRKRYFIVIGDIYGVDSKSGSDIIVIRHGEKIDYKKWNSIKRYVDKNQRFFCRPSENGIILFVSFKPENGSSYVEKFWKHTDLITAMVSRRKDMRIDISSDFIPEEDVISVTDPGKLLEEYIRSNARLIIIGESITPSYREALMRVKDYDRFVRMMVVPSIDPTTIDHFLLQVKMMYNSNRWNK